MCWDPVCNKRPLTGAVEAALTAIFNKYKQNPELIPAKNVTPQAESSRSARRHRR